jgi:hypothetical protein
MVESAFRIVIATTSQCGAAAPPTKKAEVGERFGTIRHVGLLFNEPPGSTGLFFT